jgi:hypothetical protein
MFDRSEFLLPYLDTHTLRLSVIYFISLRFFAVEVVSKLFTVDSLITHSPRDRPNAMGY